MHNKVKGFLAAQFHDAKKLLLNRNRPQNAEEDRQYAGWGPHPNHIFLDYVEDQGDASDLGSWQKDVKTAKHPLPPEVIALIKLLRGEKPKLKDGQSWPAAEKIKQFLSRLLLSLRAADALHKALYQGDERSARQDEEHEEDTQEEKESRRDDDRNLQLVKQVHVARQYPFYYPFYGNLVIWGPEEPKNLPKKIPEKLTGLAVSPQNARKVFKKLLDDLDKNGLQAANLVKLQRDRLGSFPESTYLPVTSIGFHQRFVATLFLLLYREFEQVDVHAARNPYPIQLFLNTIISPPERLTNRLRDTTVVRKISHRLQHQLHGYFKDHYLKDMDELAIRHPDENPFFFYNKDAIVLMNRATDQEEIKKICQEIAKKTESVITLDSIQVEADVPLTKAGHARAYLTDRPRTPLWFPAKKMPQVQTMEEGLTFCASCNKPTFQKDQKDEPQDAPNDRRDDPLCESCETLHEDYRYCKQCQVYVAPAEKSDTSQEKCPYCGERPRGYPSPRVLRGKNDTGEGHRVAYVAVKINAKFDAVQDEAEVLMARFRCNRYTFEGGSRAEKNALWWNLARVRPTRFGIFEYLQAAQDIARFQEDLLKTLEECWRAAFERQPRRRLPQGQFRIVHDDRRDDDRRDDDRRDDDLTRENLLSTFLYRSPTLTLVVMPEQVLPDFYQKVTALLQQLQLAHTLRIVVCRHNQPVWMALRDLGVHEDFVPLRTKELSAAFQELRAAREDKLDAQLKEKIKEMLGLCESIAEQVQSLKDSQPTNPPSWLDRLWQAVKSAIDPRGQANLILLGRFVTVAEIAQSVPQEFADLKQLAEGLISLKNEALAHATTVWQKGDTFRQIAEAARTRCSERVLTVLRSGVARMYRNAQVDFLLDSVQRHRARASSQLGNLAAYAQELLEKVREFSTDQREEDFWANLNMELAARAALKEGKKEGIDRNLQTLIQDTLKLSGLTPEQVPGLFLEISLRQKDRGQDGTRQHKGNLDHVPNARSGRNPQGSQRPYR